MSAKDLLNAKNSPRFPATVDGYFLPKSPLEIFSAGEQSHVPLLIGWNSEEQSWRRVIASGEPTTENYTKAIETLYGANAAEVLKLFPASNREEVLDAATLIASARFTGLSSWKWAELQSKTGGGKPVYRYYYSHPRPAMTAAMGNATANLAGGVTRNAGSAPARPQPRSRGAVHSAEIEYAMGNLKTNLVYEWTAEDHKISSDFLAYYANFVKTGNPNGAGLPEWPLFTGNAPRKILWIDVETKAGPEKDREQYQLMDRLPPAAR